MATKIECTVCGRGFKSKHALWGHQKAHGGKQKEAKAQTGENGKDVGAPPTTPVPTPTVTGQFYPSLDTWKSEPTTEGAEVGLEIEDQKAPSTAKPGAPAPAVFDTSGMWKAMGDFMDGSVLKNKPSKINMTDAKAKMLNDSLMSLGFMVEAPKEPVVVGYWMPFVLTAFSVFLMPLILSIAPDIFKKFPFGKKKKGEPLPEVPKKEVLSDTDDSEPIEGGPLGENLYDRRDRLP